MKWAWLLITATPPYIRLFSVHLLITQFKSFTGKLGAPSRSSPRLPLTAAEQDEQEPNASPTSQGDCLCHFPGAFNDQVIVLQCVRTCIYIQGQYRNVSVQPCPNTSVGLSGNEEFAAYSQGAPTRNNEDR